MNLSIRLAGLADAEALAGIMCRAWDAAYGGLLPADFIRRINAGRLESFRKSLAGENTRRYAVCDGEQVIGLLSAALPEEDEYARPEDYELHAIYMDPNAQGRGAGRFAMDFAFQKAKEAGKRRMVLWVLEDNAPAIRFYTSCGFRMDGTKKPYDCGMPANLARMQREL